MKKTLTKVVLVFIVTIPSILFGTFTLPLAASATSATTNISTTTPIKHLVVIFQENVSFDHYFATYPIAGNGTHEPPFLAKPDTPSVNNLSSGLLTDNPNLFKPFRIPRSNTSTCSNDHSYTRLQEACNGGLMDKFVQTNSVANGCNPSITMGYFDGNTVTALWNYAQHFAMSDDQANHQYDLGDFWNATQSHNITASGNLPEVSFLKAPRYQDGHSKYSNPLDEQNFLVNTINRLQELPEWNSTAVIITYDDSDGWYDHVMPPIVSQSTDSKYDRLLGKNGLCGHALASTYQDRCGYGPRLPFLIISPYAKVNYVDHSVTDHTSIIRFIEDNWNLWRIGNQSFDVKAGSILNMFNFTANHYAAKLFLDNSTGLEK